MFQAFETFWLPVLPDRREHKRLSAAGACRLDAYDAANLCWFGLISKPEAVPQRRLKRAPAYPQ